MKIQQIVRRRPVARRFTAVMKQPGARRDLDLLAALSHRTNLAIGCYCEDEARCHRSILRKLLAKCARRISAHSRSGMAPGGSLIHSRFGIHPIRAGTGIHFCMVN
jgi:hypothetical protein